MKVIALEEHIATADLFAAWRRFATRDMAMQLTERVAEPLMDLGEGRLRAMDEAGIDTAVLSVTTPGLQQLPASKALALQAPTNDVIADAVRRHPDRFHGFATLATSSPEMAARELERSIVDLGLDGVMLHSMAGADFLDAPRYRDIFEAADHCRAPIYLHPSSPPADVAAAYYRGLGDPIGGVLGTGAPGWHYQTGVAVLRLILSGLFDRFPNLQVIVGHWGEMVLFYLDRIVLLDGFSRLDRPLREYFRTNVFITPGGVASHRYLRWAVEVVGVDRIMHASDYPFNSAQDFAARDFITTAPLSDDDRRKVASENWNTVLQQVRRKP
ncbi:MAG: amidohydrolase family protein [Mycobacterium sp.]